MLYINKPNTTAKTYAEVVNLAVKAGIAPQKVYMYLAGLGVRGEQARIISSDEAEYSKPIKMAVRDDHTFIMAADICKSCKSLRLA